MEQYKREALFEYLKEHCPFAGDDDYIEVTEWGNGEGFDVVINRRADTVRFEITHGEFEILKELGNVFYYQ